MLKKELYVERREEGDYAVRRPGSERASDVRDTQAEAIERAREIDPTAAIHVERVRDTDRGSRISGESLSSLRFIAKEVALGREPRHVECATLSMPDGGWSVVTRSRGAHSRVSHLRRFNSFCAFPGLTPGLTYAAPTALNRDDAARWTGCYDCGGHA